MAEVVRGRMTTGLHPPHPRFDSSSTRSLFLLILPLVGLCFRRDVYKVDRRVDIEVLQPICRSRNKGKTDKGEGRRSPPSFFQGKGIMYTYGSTCNKFRHSSELIAFQSKKRSVYAGFFFLLFSFFFFFFF